MNRRSDSSRQHDVLCDVERHDPEAIADARATAPPAITIERVAAIFGALSDTTRVRILHALSRRPMCVCDLAQVAGISQSGMSHQLRLLRDRGLVNSERHGQRVMYRLADAHVAALLAQGIEHAEEERP